MGGDEGKNEERKEGDTTKAGVGEEWEGRRKGMRLGEMRARWKQEGKENGVRLGGMKGREEYGKRVRAERIMIAKSKDGRRKVGIVSPDKKNSGKM